MTAQMTKTKAPKTAKTGKHKTESAALLGDKIVPDLAFHPDVMDAAAKVAQAELDEMFDRASARDIAVWWKKHYQAAGHKRLGRVLMQLGAV